MTGAARRRGEATDSREKLTIRSGDVGRLLQMAKAITDETTIIY
jgi:hypothetical protein